MKKLNRFSFGATSSITTSLSLIVGFAATVHQKISIISALAILAVADNLMLFPIAANNGYSSMISQDSQLYGHPREN